MAKKPAKKTQTIRVRQHTMRVPVSKKNPTGKTIRRAHNRNIQFLTKEDLQKIFAGYNRSKIQFPTAGKLEAKNADLYDELIAIWCDYFNKLFPPTPPEAPLDPDVIKALISSESDFRLDPPNPKAIGIAQITPQTWKLIQDADGELKDHIFSGILKRDLKDPAVAIPVATRWLIQKRNLARSKLGRAPTPEEFILEYKGLLKSDSAYKDNALAKFRGEYDALKKR
jgi:hypothetical protein